MYNYDRALYRHQVFPISYLNYIFFSRKREKYFAVLLLFPRVCYDTLIQTGIVILHEN